MSTKQKLYQVTEDGGIRFISRRRPGEVRIPNYVYDIWMPLLGSDALGVYALYCRLEREGFVKQLKLKDIANICRIGIARLEKVNQELERCGFIKVTKPGGIERLKHWTTRVEIYDPPTTVSKELITELAIPSGYKILTHWLVEDEKESQSETPEIDSGISGDRIQDFMGVPESISMIESLELNPLNIAHGAGAQNAPPGNLSLPVCGNLGPPKESLIQMSRSGDPDLVARAQLLALGLKAKQQAPEAVEKIRLANWQIKDSRCELAVAAFLEATGLKVPATKTERGQWLAGARDHLDEFGLEGIEELYRMAWNEYLPKVMEGELDITHPLALTKKMRAIKQRAELLAQSPVDEVIFVDPKTGREFKW